MKRDASLARSPLKPARAVHVRLSRADTQTALPPPDPRLSQATTLAASSPLDTDCRPWLLAGLLILPPGCAPAASPSPFSALSGPSCRGSPRRCQPLCRFRVVNSDFFLHARAWLPCSLEMQPRSCLEHRPSRLSTTAPSGAANAPPWMRTPAPSLWPSSASRARLPPVVASEGREQEHAIGAVRPLKHGSPAVGDTIMVPLGTTDNDGLPQRYS